MKTVYKFIPVPVFYTNWFIPNRYGAISLGFFVLIRPEYKGNTALLEHELQHCRQFWRTLWVHAPLYFLSKRYRLYAECDAYAVQIKYGGSYDWAIQMLTNYYNLNISEREARAHLDERLNNG